MAEPRTSQDLPDPEILDRRQFDLAFTGLELGVRYAQEDLGKIRNQVLRLRHDWRAGGQTLEGALNALLAQVDDVERLIGATLDRARPL